MISIKSIIRNISAAGIRSFGTISILYVCTLLYACDSSSPEYLTLFGAEQTELLPEDMQSIYAVFGERYARSSDGTRLEDSNCGDIQAKVESVDLNSDGQPEVFVHWGNACTSGATGRSLSMFVKNNHGQYAEQFSFPAFGYTALSNQNAGYPDLQFGGPGFCFAVWAWTGDTYKFKCNLPQEAGGCQLQGRTCLN